jgi:NADPH:quinone reductase-like Zn-dependent oxidoreductase
MGPIVVTGAAGGVGSMACLILKKLKFTVWAATSNIEDSKEQIAKLKVDKHVDKTLTNDKSGKPLGKTLWAGAIDCVGGNTLVTLLK